MADSKAEDRPRMARAQWGGGNWGPELSPHEGLKGTEAEDRTAEAGCCHCSGSKAARHKTNAQDRKQ